MGMAIAKTCHCYAAAEIEISLSLRRGQPSALAPLEGEFKTCIGGKQRGVHLQGSAAISDAGSRPLRSEPFKIKVPPIGAATPVSFNLGTPSVRVKSVGLGIRASV